MAFAFAVSLGGGPVIAEDSGATWRSLMGTSLDGWEVFTGVPHQSVMVDGLPPSKSKDGRTGTPIGLRDPLKIFAIETLNGEPVLHVSGQVYAGLTTKESFSNYHLSLEYKWGEKKWPPRTERERDSGILIHCNGEHGAFWNVWMQSLECQVQETDTGDLYALGGTSARVPSIIAKENSKTFQPGGKDHSIGAGSGGGKITRSQNQEIPGDWNHVEVIAVGDEAIFKVNGHVVMHCSNARIGSQKSGKPLTSGRIQIQSEAAEVLYRNIRVRSVDKLPSSNIDDAATKQPSRITGLSAIKGTRSKVCHVAAVNEKAEPATVNSSLVGDDANFFQLVSPTSTQCDVGESIDVQVVFHPPADLIGTAQATLQVRFGDDPPVEHSLRGLSTRGLEGKNEAALSDVLETLGYRVNLGWQTLANHVKPEMMGDELSAKLFQKAESGNVEIIPVARYSPSFALPFGYYTSSSQQESEATKPTLHQVGVLSGDKTYPEHQTLHPAITEGGTTFDPGDQAFGIFTTSPSHVAYSEDVWNRRLHQKNAAHACRIYAAADASGKLMMNQYLFCFEEAFNGDYQDYVFLVRNIKPAIE